MTPSDVTRRRILLAKPGLDGHDRGVLVVAASLRDAGHEVIYTGLRQSPAMIAAAAQEEDVVVVGLSVLSGAHLSLVTRVMQALSERGLGHVQVVVGGIIPEGDRPALTGMGVVAIFGPGTSTRDIVAFFEQPNELEPDDVE